MKPKGTTRPDLRHWGDGEQECAAANIRSRKDTATAAIILRSELSLSRSLRDALADYLEGRIKLRRTSKGRTGGLFAEGKPWTEREREAWKSAIKDLIAKGQARPQALRTLLERMGLDPDNDFSSLDNFLKGKHRKRD